MPFDSDWPHSDHSRIVEVPPHKWHLQSLGDGPDLLLLHGTGASTHSFAQQLPYLAKSYRATAVDLPGQGFSRLGNRNRCGMRDMAADIRRLLEAEDIAPKYIVAHSAGAAVALEMAPSLPDLKRIVALNAALESFPGPAGVVFPAMAKVLSLLPGTARMFSFVASGKDSVTNLIQSTGSRLPAAQLDCYRRLLERPEHVEAALLMMAQWDLNPLLAKLPQVTTPTVFLGGANDRAVSPGAARRAAQVMPKARFELIANLGHLMHEEAPDDLNTLIGRWLTEDL